MILGLILHLPFQTNAQYSQPHPSIAAAEALLSNLTHDQKHKCMFEFDNMDRFDWHFTPRQRPGLAWEDMTQLQRSLGSELLKSGISDIGFNKAMEIMDLENVLRVLENRGDDDRMRHPELYYFTFFGTPDNEGAWGWRFEGHHISLNFTIIDNQMVVTPSFFGANPARIPSGPNEGKRVLASEEDLARALVLSLSDDQQELAITSKTAPPDLIDGAISQVDVRHSPEGIPVLDLSASQLRMFEKLVDVYLEKLNEKERKLYQAEIDSSGWKGVHFCWKGGLNVGDGHYYRIQGPELWIEYDNTQNNNNHIHSIFRGIHGDFGRDILKDHYAKHHR